MEVLTQLIELLRQLTDLVLGLQHLIALLQDLLRPLSKIRLRIPSYRYQYRRPKPPQTKPRQKRKWSQSYLEDPLNRELQDKLKAMLHYDIATAKRLLKQQRQLYPGQTDNWYLEKVIYDLERENNPKKWGLQQKLIEMLQGDIATAERLLWQQRQQQPGKLDNWYLEKVIYDLERDKH